MPEVEQQPAGSLVVLTTASPEVCKNLLFAPE